MKFAKYFWRYNFKQYGQSIVEYTLIVFLIGFAVTGSLTVLSSGEGGVSSKFDTVGNAMDQSVENSREELQAQENEKNVRNYSKGNLIVPGGNNISTPPTYGGDNGLGGSKSAVSPTENKPPVASFKIKNKPILSNIKIDFLNTSTDPDGDRIVK